MSFIFPELIRKKREGGTHTSAELEFIVNEYLAKKIPDYQMSAWLMAVYFKGMENQEMGKFTSLMKKSGRSLKLNRTNPIIDKHSSGGVGDKVSLILAPILACYPVTIPMISGRGLGHTGGTLDKLESIPNFKTEFSFEEILSNLKKYGWGIFAQTPEICPLDKQIYALRDVTGTVESLSLICSSIMSKKLAESLDHLLLDIKCGTGAFMKNKKDALILAKTLKKLGEINGVKVRALITNMNEPLGSTIGNLLEVLEVIEILDNKTKIINDIDLYEDLKNLTILQASHMLVMSGIFKTLAQAKSDILKKINTKEALNKFKDLCLQQGGKFDAIDKNKKECIEVLSPQNGYISFMNAEDFGYAAISLGAGRIQKGDKINPYAGIEVLFKKHMKIKKGQVLFKLYGDLSDHKEISKKILSSLKFSKKPNKEKLILKILK